MKFEDSNDPAACRLVTGCEWSSARDFVQAQSIVMKVEQRGRERYGPLVEAAENARRRVCILDCTLVASKVVHGDLCHALAAALEAALKGLIP